MTTTTQARRTVTNEQLVDGITKWAWVAPSSLIKPEGTRVVTYPAIQRDKVTGESAPRLQVTAHKTGKGLSFLLNVRAGWGEGATVPAALLTAANAINPLSPDTTNAAYLSLKNKHQVTLSFNSELESHQDALDKLAPGWKAMARAGSSIKLRRGIELDVIGLRFAADDAGKLIINQNGNVLYNWSMIEVKATTIDQEIEATAQATGGGRVAINANDAMAALGIQVPAGQAFGAPADDIIAGSRADAPAPVKSIADVIKDIKGAGYTAKVPQVKKLMDAGYDSQSIIDELDGGETIEDMVAALAAA